MEKIVYYTVEALFGLFCVTGICAEVKRYKAFSADAELTKMKIEAEKSAAAAKVGDAVRNAAVL